MTTTTTYRIVNRPKNSDLIEFSCLICGHPELTRPVFLEGPGGTIFAAGTRCAAKAIYGDESAPAQRRVRNEFDLIAHNAQVAEEMRLERTVRFTTALDAYHTNRDADPALISARKSFHATKPAGFNFPEFIAHVATTGEFPS